jgi:hypothetical protein
MMEQFHELYKMTAMDESGGMLDGSAHLKSRALVSQSIALSHSFCAPTSDTSDRHG